MLQSKKHSLIPRNDQCAFFSQKHRLTHTHWAPLTLLGLSEATEKEKEGLGKKLLFSPAFGREKIKWAEN